VWVAVQPPMSRMPITAGLPVTREERARQEMRFVGCHGFRPLRHYRRVKFQVIISARLALVPLIATSGTLTNH
jgi:hypothetical protein